MVCTEKDCPADHGDRIQLPDSGTTWPADDTEEQLQRAALRRKYTPDHTPFIKRLHLSRPASSL